MEISLSLGEIFPPLRNCGSLAIAGHLPFSFALRKSTSMTRPPQKWQNILLRPTFERSENAATIQHCLYPRTGEGVIEGTLCMSPIWGPCQRRRKCCRKLPNCPLLTLYFVNIFLYHDKIKHWDSIRKFGHKKVSFSKKKYSYFVCCSKIYQMISISHMPTKKFILQLNVNCRALDQRPPGGECRFGHAQLVTHMSGGSCLPLTIFIFSWMFGCLQCEEILVPNPDINCPRATASATRCNLHFNVHQKYIKFFLHILFPINEMPIECCNLELQFTFLQSEALLHKTRFVQ